MHLLASVALCALVLAATLRFLAPALLHLFLFPPHLRISHLTLSSIRGVRLTTGHGVQIDVDCVSLARPKGGEGDRGAWAVLRVEGVKVVVPLEALSRSPASKSKPAARPPPPPPAHDKAAPPHPPPPRRRPHPLLALATRLVPRLAHRIALRIAPVRILLGAGAEGDAPRPTLKLSLVAGVSSTRRAARAHPHPRPHPHSRPRAHSHPLEHALGVHELGAWVRISGVSLVDGARPPSTGSSSSGAAAEVEPEPELERHKPALELPGAFELRIALELARGRWEPREGSVDVTLVPLGGRCGEVAADELGAGTCGLDDGVDEWGVGEQQREERAPERRARDEDEAHEGALLVRVQELECLLERFKDALGAAKAQQGPPPHERAERRDDGADADAQAASAQRAKAARSRKVLRLLGSVELALPPVVLAAHYAAPSSARASSLAPVDAADAAAGEARPSTMALALAVRGARVQLRRGAARKEHEGWIAQGEEAWSAGAEWAEVEGRVRLGRLEDDEQGASHILSLSRALDGQMQGG